MGIKLQKQAFNLFPAEQTAKYLMDRSMLKLSFLGDVSYKPTATSTKSSLLISMPLFASLETR